MKRAIFNTLFILLTLSNVAFGFDRMASEIELFKYDRFTVDYRRLHVGIDVEARDSELVKLLKLEINKCGISTTTSSCLDSMYESKKSPFSFMFKGGKGERFLIKGLHRPLDSQLQAVQVVTIHVENKIRIFDKVEFFKSNEILSSNFFNKFFKSYANGDLTPMFSADEFVPHKYEDYISKAQVDGNAISLFHSLFLALKNIGEVEVDELKGIISEKIEIISSLKDPIYQKEYIEFLKGDKVFDKEVFESIISSYLNSSSKEVQIEAALSLGLENIRNDKSKLLIIETLNNISLSLKKRALEALFTIREGLTDDVLIINMMKHVNSEISKSAFHFVMRMDLEDEHLPAISTLFHSNDHAFRGFAIDLVNKINTESGKNKLIDLMSDNHPDNVEKVYRLLKLREINENDIKRFKNLLNNNREFTKFYSLYFVNLDESTDGTKAILTKIADKSDKVKGMALQLLNERDFTSINRSILNGYIENKKSRLAGLMVLNKYKDSGATNLMIRNLKHFKGDDLNTVFNTLRSRDFDGSEFSALKDTFSKFNKVEVRVVVIKLFIKIPSKRALKFLKKKKRFAFSSDVKNALKIVIDHFNKTI